MSNIPSLSRALTLALLGVALGGCHLWEDYSTTRDQSAECSSRDVEQLDVGSDPVEVRTRLCPDTARVFEFELSAGDRLAVDIADYDVESTVSVELYAADQDPTNDRPIAFPVWTDDGVELDDLITRSGPYLLVVESNTATPADMKVAASPARGTIRWIDPAGEPDGFGSFDEPFADWPTALAALHPGDVLIARPGTWTNLESCEGLAQPCRTDSPMAEVDCRNIGVDGEMGAPITIAAERERRTHLVSNGDGAPLEFLNCHHWEADGLSMQSRDRPDVGVGDGVRLFSSEDITLRRLLVRRPNRIGFSSLIEVANSSRIIIEENELYDFHLHGIYIHDSNDCEVRRTFINSRDYPDIETGGSWRRDLTRGDMGVYSLESEGLRIADTIAEDVHAGFLVRSVENSQTGGDSHRFDGCMARDVTDGFRIRTGTSDCNDPSADSCAAADNVITNCVSIASTHGFRIDGGINNRVRYSSAFATSGGVDTAAGFSLHEPIGDNRSRAPVRELVIERSSTNGNADSTGLLVDDDLTDVSVAYVNSTGHQMSYASPGPFSLPDTATEVEVDRDGCMVYVPPTSPLYEVDGERIGANIIHRHESGAATRAKLWDQRDGSFPCGAIIEGVNDQPGASCFDAHERLGVGQPGCPVP